MKKIALTLSLALASMLGSTSFAQTAGPSQDQASPSAPATAGEKAAAKKTRKAQGAAASTTAMSGDDQPASAGGGMKMSKDDKKAAKMKRKAAGAEATKDAKDKSGPN